MPLTARNRASIGPAWQREAEARRINAQPWEPLPGMVKRRCTRCHYWFAVAADEAEATSRCPDCVALERPRKRSNNSAI
jgi:hypothetical protein